VSTLLSPRWTPLRHHPVQQAYWNSPHRFNVIPAGRRSGKTELFKRKLVTRALEAATEWTPAFFAGAPTREQAKRIFWDDLKLLVGRDMMMCPPSETELKITAINGAEIWVIGMDKPERVEGKPWDGGGLDEFANCKETAWKANIRPALSDRHGWFDLFGVPEGRNHYYELDLMAKAEMLAKGAASDWGEFGWPSREILPPEEIEAAMRDLDELTFDQEYNASFVNFSGRCYYAFNQKEHCAPLKYDPRAPLILCFDFNVAPGCAAIIQEQQLPGQFEHQVILPTKAGEPTRYGPPLLDRPIIGTGVIAEVHIPQNSNTPAVCRKIAQMFPEHKGPVYAYGDATGGASGSAKVLGNDWDLIEAELRPVYANRGGFALHVKSKNPLERSRVNAVNSRFKAKSGDIRMMVDLAKCPNVVKDFDGVTLLKGGSGEIDKDETPELTHLSDAIGYYLESKYPVSGPSLIKVEIAGR
jgi:hypothetical protein